MSLDVFEHNLATELPLKDMFIRAMTSDEEGDPDLSITIKISELIKFYHQSIPERSTHGVVPNEDYGQLYFIPGEGLYYLKRGSDTNDYLLVSSDTGNYIGQAGVLTIPTATPDAGDYYIASEGGDFTLFNPPVGGVLEVTKGDYIRWFESENKWVLERKYLNIKSDYDIPVVMDTPISILFADSGYDDYPDGNYSLTVNCYDSGGYPVGIRRISKTSEGFEIEPMADGFIDWITK